MDGIPEENTAAAGPSRRILLSLGIASLLLACGFTWTWRELIFAHLYWKPARTELLELGYPISPKPEVQNLTPQELPPHGGLLLRLPAES